MASTSNKEILKRFQSEALRMIVHASWCVSNTFIQRDLQKPTVNEEIRHYNAHLSTHQNNLIVNEPHGATRQQAIAKTPAK
jgi:hypothetical protein